MWKSAMKIPSGDLDLWSSLPQILVLAVNLSKKIVPSFVKKQQQQKNENPKHHTSALLPFTPT